MNATVDQFATRLRKSAATCDFASIHKQVKSALLQNCSSKRLRRYALFDNKVTLAKLLAKGRRFEPSKSQATGIEKSLETTNISNELVNALGRSNQIYVQQQALNPHPDSSTQPLC